jgi:hypothetical protein
MVCDDEVKATIEADTGIRPSFALEAFPDLAADVRQPLARTPRGMLVTRVGISPPRSAHDVEGVSADQPDRGPGRSRPTPTAQERTEPCR